MKISKMIQRCVLLAVVLCAVVSAQAPKYVFLFIGDGMGENHRIAADCYWKNSQILQGKDVKDVKGLEMNELPVSGLVTTFPKNADVTDSAASASAMSSGHKVDNGVLNLDVQAGMTFEPMAVFAKKMGYKTGILSSVPLNHATPAGFYAVQKNRGDYYEIALQLAASDVDYFGATYVQSIPADKDNIRQLAIDNGFKIAETKEAIMALTPCKEKVWVFEMQSIPYAIDHPTRLTLADYTAKGIELLENPDGFFMMVEGGKIDHAAHSNDGAAMIYETIAFNDAIKQALDFYRSHPEQTLIVVTADHQTGELELDFGKLESPEMCKAIDGQKGSYADASEMLKDIERSRPDFDGVIAAFQDFFGIAELTEQEMTEIKTAYGKSGYAKGDFSYGENKYITTAFLRLVSSRAGMNWGSMSHTATPVRLTAIGAGAEMFAGNTDNTLVCWYIRELMTQKHEEELKE